MGQLGMKLLTGSTLLNYAFDLFSSWNALSAPKEIPFFKEMYIKPYLDRTHFANFDYLKLNSSGKHLEHWKNGSKYIISFHFE